MCMMLFLQTGSLWKPIATARTGIRFSAFWTGMEENAVWRKCYSRRHTLPFWLIRWQKRHHVITGRDRRTPAWCRHYHFTLSLQWMKNGQCVLSGILGDHAVGTWFIRDEYAMLDFFFFFFFFFLGGGHFSLVVFVVLSTILCKLN